MSAANDVSSSAMASSRWRVSEVLFWVVVLACPFLFPSRYLIMTDILRLALFTLSLDLILGYAGIVSLGHAAFFGVGAYTAGLLALHGIINEPVIALVVAGRNVALKKRLDEVAAQTRGRVVPFGFVDNMHELMAISDLVITKPGGLTSSESLAMGKPLFILNPMVPIIESFRFAFLGGGIVEIWHLAVSATITLILLFIGLVMFSHFRSAGFAFACQSRYMIQLAIGSTFTSAPSRSRNSNI